MFIPVSCETLGHLLQHVIGVDVLLEEKAGEVVLAALAKKLYYRIRLKFGLAQVGQIWRILELNVKIGRLQVSSQLACKCQYIHTTLF